jgi:hypothetical protein
MVQDLGGRTCLSSLIWLCSSRSQHLVDSVEAAQAAAADLRVARSQLLCQVIKRIWTIHHLGHEFDLVFS